MLKYSRYAGRKVALLTQHGKARVISPEIAPVLEPALGRAIELLTGFDNDQLGTLTLDTLRRGPQLEATRCKPRKGLERGGSGNLNNPVSEETAPKGEDIAP